MSAGKRCWPNVGSMLIHRCPTLNQHWRKISSLSQLARNTHPMLASKHIDPMLVWCWSTVYDAGPTSNQHWQGVSCLAHTWQPPADMWIVCHREKVCVCVWGGGGGSYQENRDSHVFLIDQTSWLCEGGGGLYMWMGGGSIHCEVSVVSSCIVFLTPSERGPTFDGRIWRL